MVPHGREKIIRRFFMFNFKRLRNQAGAALVEYSLLVAGVALVGAAAVSMFGHKTTDLMAATAAILPGAHDEDNGPIVSGQIIETTDADDGPIALDFASIAANVNTSRLGNNLGDPVGAIETLVVEPPTATP
jgi:pilus assembly protein Flp/PilA